jgi:FAD binding domain
MHELSRRGLLKATAAAGAGVVVSQRIMDGAAPGFADGSDWHSNEEYPLAELTGRIVRPQDPDYPKASLGWDELFVHYPLVIVFAQETQDVVNALTWARQNNVALRVRSGRHALEGWSNVDNGIVIDVSELKSADIDEATRIAKVGAGLNQGEAVAALATHDLAVTTGTEASVGLSGATLGGGLGFLNRYLGMACDSLIGAEIVVAAGCNGAKAINVDLEHHEDLLWALRGAGNGNFGIVTSLTYKAAPLRSVAYLQATWEGLDDLQGVFNTWQHTAPLSDNRLGTQLEIHKPQILLFAVLAEGSEAEIRELLARSSRWAARPSPCRPEAGARSMPDSRSRPRTSPRTGSSSRSSLLNRSRKRRSASSARSWTTPPRMIATSSPRPSEPGFRRASLAAARRSCIATRSSTPSPARAGAPVDSRTATTRSPQSPRPGSPSSARHCDRS